MPVDLRPKSHVDTPAWQSFELRMRARAAERRAQRRQRRIRRLTYVGAGVLAVATGVASGYAVQMARQRAALESASLQPIQPPIVDWPLLPSTPNLLTTAALQSLPLPTGWDNARISGQDAATVASPELAPLIAETRGTAEDSPAASRGQRTPAAPDVTHQPERRDPVHAGSSPQAGSPPTSASSIGSSRETQSASTTVIPRPTFAAPQAATNGFAPVEPGARTATTRPVPPETPTTNTSFESSVGAIRPTAPEEPPVGTSSRNTPAPARASSDESRSAPSGVGGEPSVGTSVVPDARQSVRAVLERYRSAYQRLDAPAARAVWPAVDEGALARAFSALSAQELWFEGCTIITSGTTADATCKGQARIVPKIGGGSETARRTWQFKLREAGGDWLIERAIVK